MSKKVRVFIEVFIIIAALAGSIYVAVTPANSLMNWFNIDDAFYYYKVAQNILAGHGSTFDGINLSNGFHPLWMAVCLSVFWLSRFNLLLPLRVLVVVSGFFNAAAAFFLFRLLIRYIHPAAAIIGALAWAIVPPIYSVVIVHGMESVVGGFFLILLLYLAARYLEKSEHEKISLFQFALLGLAGAATIFARLDTLFVVGCVGFFVLFRIRKIPMTLIYDWAALTLAVVLSWVFRLGVSGIEQNKYSIYPMIAIAFLVNPIVYYFSGMYQGFSQRGTGSKLIRQAAAAVINFIWMFGICTLLFDLGILKMFSKSVLAFYAVLAFLFILCLRVLENNQLTGSDPKPFRTFGKWVNTVWREVLLEAIAYAIPIGGIVGLYMVFNKIYFGTFSPISGQIKTWWSTLPNTVYSHPDTLITILGLSPVGNYGPWSLLTSRIKDAADYLTKTFGNQVGGFNSLVFLLLFLLLVLLVTAILKAENKRLGKMVFSTMAAALLIGCLLQIAYFTTIGYAHTRTWYWVSEMLFLVILGAIVLGGLFDWLKHFKSFWSVGLTILAVGLLLVVHVRYLHNTYPMKVSPQNESAYLNDTRELESYTPEGSKIGMTGGGMVAYFIENRTIINLDGLINSAEYFHALKTGTATQFLDKIPLNYVYGNEYVLTVSDPYAEIFKNRLQEIGVIRGPDNFTLYKYVILN